MTIESKLYFISFNFAFIGDRNPCADRAYDWVIIFDESGSIAPNDFTFEKDFAKTLVDWLTIGPNNHMMGAMCFNTNGRTHFHLNDNNNAAGIKNDIDAIVQAGGGTNIAKALEVFYTQWLR